MIVYIDAVALLNFSVDFLLLLGANQLCGYPPDWKRITLGATLGGLYASACFLPGFYFLRNLLWRLICLALMSWISFGNNKSAVRRGGVFVLLSMSMSGFVACVGTGNLWTVISAAILVSVLCLVGFKEKIGTCRYVPVELSYGDRHLKLTALCDTGNMLRDPVTGRSILVVGADVAAQLVGLSRQQLSSPVESLTNTRIPGLRLVPYRGVGQSGGLLLALRMQNVKIGTWKGCSLVAFAPDGLCRENTYQALTGGTI